MSGAPTTVVAVPSWNRRQRVLECLQALARVAEPPLEVVVIDNASDDGSAAAVRAAFSDVRLIELPENLGFAGAANAGLAFARRRGAPYCLVLNDDAVVAADAVALLAAALDRDPEAAAAGPTIYYFDRPRVIWSAGGDIDWRRGRTRMLAIDEVDDGQLGADPRPVPFVSGCAMLMRLSAVERAGAFDPRFFAYYEEVEWCVRCARLGGRVLHVPRSRVWHHISAEARAASPLVHYYMTRNRLLFLRAAGAPATAWLQALLLDDARTLLSWSLRRKWRSHRAQRDAKLRALADFWQGRSGRAPLAGA